MAKDPFFQLPVTGHREPMREVKWRIVVGMVTPRSTSTCWMPIPKRGNNTPFSKNGKNQSCMPKDACTTMRARALTLARRESVDEVDNMMVSFVVGSFIKSF